MTEWTWNAASDRYRFSVRGPVFLNESLPVIRGHVAPAGAVSLPDDAVIARAGAAGEPLSWRLADRRYPDASSHVVTLEAVEHPVVAVIALTCDEATGVLRWRVALRHVGEGPALDIVAAPGMWMGIHEPIVRMLYLQGEWAEETQVRRVEPGAGELVIESRAGKTGFAAQPYVALCARDATYLCQILWSGNWMMRARAAGQGALIRAGLHDWKFRHRLRPGARLELPDVLFLRAEGGLNLATQRLHDYRRAHRRHAARPVPVQFNSWYPIFGEPTAETIAPLVPVAARLGCEAFVVDAGWYRTAATDSAGDWRARTGDWLVSWRRFPTGMRAISTACRESGLRFGLWFEPEVIGLSSELRHNHPEWMHHIDGVAPRPDERAVLNLGIMEARRYVRDRLARVISRLGVGWMKWDFNADLGPGGWAPGLPERLTAGDPLIAHYRGLYRLQDSLCRRFPDLILEMCASGGGRMDGEILSRADVNWISDQPGAVRKLAIHFGTQLAHPAAVCNDWLVEWPPGAIRGYDDRYGQDDTRGDLAFRLRVAMLGSFGISASTARWSEGDFELACAHVALYRDRLRAIIQDGDQYLLTSSPPADGNGDWAAIWYARKDGRGGVLFAFRLLGREVAREFPLAGLRAEQNYRLRTFAGVEARATGAALAAGWRVGIGVPFHSELVLVEAD